MPIVNDFNIGCDPEFVTLDADGRLINLAQFPEFNSENTEIGYDHGGDVAELRPNPSPSTFQVTKNLHKLILSDRWKNLPIKKMRAGAIASWQGMHETAPVTRGRGGLTDAPGRVRWMTDAGTGPQSGAMTEGTWAPPRGRSGRDHISLGGHVHLDINPLRDKILTTDGSNELDPWDEESYNYSRYTTEHTLRLRALDHLTHRLEALDILPRAECTQRRRFSGYGKFGEFRVHTPERTVFDAKLGTYVYPKPRTEYRTMASWLFHPAVTFLCLTGAKLAAFDPKRALECLGKVHNWDSLKNWIEGFKDKDFNAARLCSKVLDKGIKAVQFDPNEDLRARWEAIAL